ncbi:MAG: response regulator transcription factor [Ardenticatenaceae bacterium]|nr:response regulator transcription factor [Anaerolineales bacterium]MCB9009306.1 response regulator transcription factor [Ardenticatenaceae bacterium]
MKIVLVDDHLIFREGVAGLLHSQPGIQVVGIASTVSQAIDLVQTHKPDLILMDYILPDGTGVEATKAILSQQPNSKIVFLSVHEDDEHLFAALRCGAIGYLPKSISFQELLAFLRGVERGEAALTRRMVTRMLKQFSHSAPPLTASINKLTPREVDVLRELAVGMTNKNIAQKLAISEKTVKAHVGNIFKKLDIDNRLEAADLARRYNI